MTIDKSTPMPAPIKPNKKPSLVTRAKMRRAELVTALAAQPADELRARGDIELALASVDGYLTGDLEHLSGTTADGIERWLESSKHLAEKPAHE